MNCFPNWNDASHEGRKGRKGWPKINFLFRRAALTWPPRCDGGFFNFLCGLRVRFFKDSSQPVSRAQSGDGARASARFNVQIEESQKMPVRLALRELKRRERRAPPRRAARNSISRASINSDYSFCPASARSMRRSGTSQRMATKTNSALAIHTLLNASGIAAR